MKSLQFSLLFLFLIYTYNVKADSPLTSTDIYKAFENLDIIKRTAKDGPKLKQYQIDFLLDENQAIDVKIGLINRLGWDFNGKSNSKYLCKKIFKLKGYKNKEDFTNRGRYDELICFAYMKAMDNYFDVNEAIVFAEAAVNKNPKSYSCQMILALLYAQNVRDIKEWCKIFKYCDNVRNNISLFKDMRTEAVEEIFNYVDIYKKYCI